MIASLVVVVALEAAILQAAPNTAVTGLWLDAAGQAAVRIHACDRGLCGTIVWLSEPLDGRGEPKRDGANPNPALRSRPLLGIELLYGFEPNERPLEWHRGRVYDPENGKTYEGKMKLENGTLHLRGYVGIPLFGRTTRWERPPQEHPARRVATGIEP